LLRKQKLSGARRFRHSKNVLANIFWVGHIFAGIGHVNTFLQNCFLLRKTCSCFVLLSCVPGVCCYLLQCLRERDVKNTKLWAQRERERENAIEKQNNNKQEEKTQEGPELINHS
jgi:hypothetical protein